MSSIEQGVAAGTPPATAEVQQQGIIAVPPPQPLPAAPEVGTRSGLVPACLVLVLAFFLASTPARNTDFWLHLATGKALLQGHYQFGVEPFTAGESSGYWANPSWLYDVLVYLLYQTLGGTVLVILKGLLIAGMAWLMIAGGQSGRSLYLSSFTSGLALVAMGPWLALKPMCLSFFFLAWMIWYLEKRLAQEEKPLSLRSFWPLLLICALWANLDRWFFLGPLTIGSYFLGALLSRKTRNTGQALGVLFLASLAMCLVNPHHIYLMAVPAQMFGSAALQLQADPLLQSLAAPFHANYFSSLLFQTPPALAFWTLAVLGILSFCSDWSARPWRWLLLGTFLFLLCLVHTPAIPFFAIAAGPILARNLACSLSRPEATWNPKPLLPLGRALVFLILIALALTAWPGWLQIGPYGPRAWRVEMDPGMQALGEKLARWHEQGKVPAQSKVFPFNPDTGNYLAWLCPRLPCWINSNLHLSDKETGDFLAVREGLSGVKAPGTPQRDWLKVLHEDKVSVLVIHGGDPATMAVMKNLNPDYLLAIQGKGAVLAWRDPWQDPKTVSPSAPKANLAKEMYSCAVPAAEMNAAERGPIPLRWWDAFWRPRYVPSVDRDEANTLLALFDGALGDRKNYYVAQSKIVAELAYSIGLPGPANLNVCFLAAGCPSAKQKPNSALNKAMVKAFLRNQDDGPPELLYLAVRACRRALQANPDDAQATFLLGESYARLRDYTRERSWGPVLGNFRTCQVLAAYRQALKLDPKNWRAHDRMAEVFQSMIDYKDLTLQHLKELHKLRARSPAPGESKEQFQDRMGLLKKTIQFLEKEVQTLSDRLAVNSGNLRIVDRANLAGQYGLSGKALAILLNSDIAAFGVKGLEMELKLLLNTGRLEEIKNWLTPKHRDLLGDTTYLLITAQLEAGLGNYAEAEKALQDMIVTPAPWGKKLRPRNMLIMAIGNSLLFEAAGGPFQLFPIPMVNRLADQDSITDIISFGTNLMDQEAISLVLQGVLALESGANQKAIACFRPALAFWDSPAGTRFTGQRSVVGRQIARYFLHQLAKTNP